MKVTKLILIGILFCFSLTSFAQGPPITSQTPVMLGLSGSGIRTFGKIIQKENASIYIHVIGIPYNINPKFQIGAITPFKFVSPKESKTTGGLADMTFFAKYQLYKKDGKAKTFRVLANFKQSFPTGKAKSSPKIGAGIYQTYLGLIVGKLSSKAGFYSDFGYNITSNSVSDNFLYNFSVGIPLLPQKYPQKQINTFIGFNGNYSIKPQINMLFLSPGLQFIAGRRMLFESSFQIPISQQNNTANKTNYMLLLGTRFLLN